MADPIILGASPLAEAVRIKLRELHGAITAVTNVHERGDVAQRAALAVFGMALGAVEDMVEAARQKSLTVDEVEHMAKLLATSCVDSAIPLVRQRHAMRARAVREEGTA